MTRQCSCGYGLKHPRNLKTLYLYLTRRLRKLPDNPCPMCLFLERTSVTPGARTMTEAEWCGRKKYDENPWTRRNWNPPSWL